MLAIKSVPMPTTCGNCMFGRSLMDTLGDAYCAIFPTLPTQVGVRPDWCPLEDVPPRMRGRWIEPTEDNDYWECPVCHDTYELDVDVTPQDARLFFCPNCGADMRGGQDD